MRAKLLIGAAVAGLIVLLFWPGNSSQMSAPQAPGGTPTAPAHPGLARVDAATAAGGIVRTGATAAVDAEAAKAREEFLTTRRRIVDRLGKALAGVHLAPATLERLYDLLAEQELAIRDAIEERRKLLVVRAGSPRSEHYDKAVRDAEAAVQIEIKQSLSPAEYELVSLLTVSARFHINVITRVIDPTLASIGAPLTPEQYIPLARAMREIYGEWHYTDPRRELFALSAASPWRGKDEALLAQAGTFLSAAQVNALRQALADYNRDIADRQGAPWAAGGAR